MKFLNKIFALLTTIVLFVSSNGFYVEKYLCNSCEQVHSEVAFFEFGEYSHNHKACNSCDHHTNCSCHHQSEEEHLQHSKVSFYSLNELFFEYDIVKVPKASFTDLFNLQLFPIDILSNYNSFDNIFTGFLKIPPLLRYQSFGIDIQALFSVFRL